MPYQVMVDLGKLKTLYSGLGQFSYYFGKHLACVNEETIRWNLLTPGSYRNKFGTGFQYETLSIKRRYFPFLCSKYDLWHAIHQDSAYFPGHAGTIYILTIHDLNFLREKGEFRVKYLLSNLQQKVDKASYITFISNFTASEANKYLHIGNKPTKVIHNGVEIDTEKITAKPKFLPGGKFLFALGMVLEKKNFHVLVDFIDRVKDYSLIIAGDKNHSYARKVEKLILKRKLSHKIIMPGIISEDDKIYLYKNCEAFLFPSLNEGFGLPVIEAMRFGKPVFTSRFSSLPEIGGNHAVYWDSFDPEHMAEIFTDHMNFYRMNSPRISEELKRYSQGYTWDRSINAYLDVYKEVLVPLRKRTGTFSIDGKPVRILHLSSEIGWRGGEQQIAYLIEELHKLGAENLVGCARNSKFEELCRSNGWKYFSAGFSSYLNLDTARNVARICRNNKIDILHLHTSKSHTVGVLSTLYGHDAKLVLTRRVDNEIGKNFLSRWKYNHPRIKRIMTVSDKIREIVKPVLKNPGKSITVHSGVDALRFENHREKRNLRDEYRIAPGEALIGNTSAIAKHKDYITFVNTCEWLTGKGFKCRFMIIGEGPEQNNIRNYITARNLSRNIIMTGFRKDIPLILPGLDIFLMTSVTEGLGTSILDAFAARIPVVATRAGGIPEMVIDGETGLLADPGDSVGLGQNILRIAGDNGLRNLLTTNAYRLLCTEFTKSAMANKVMGVYKEIL
jgi:glycosyltransferase involved in cell wall biosynthesis